jgi:hypothetical protein
MFRVEKQAKLETSIKQAASSPYLATVAADFSICSLLCQLSTSGLTYSLTLKMEVTCSSETFFDFLLST